MTCVSDKNPGKAPLVFRFGGCIQGTFPKEEIVAKRLPSSGQAVVEQWSSNGQAMVKRWSSNGQAVAKQLHLHLHVIPHETLHCVQGDMGGEALTSTSS